MVNLRMIALAAALLLVVPALALAGPDQDVHEAYAGAHALVRDFRVLDAPVKPHDHEWAPQEERLVEGHTSYVVLETSSVHEPIEGEIDVEAFVSCQANAKAYYTTWNGIPVPTRLGRAESECSAGGRVVVTPSVWCSLQGNPSCTSSALSGDGDGPAMSPTGRVLPFTTPAGQDAYAEELSFEAPDPATGDARAYYAWVTPVLAPWTDAEGVVRNMMLPVPADRLAEMGTDDFRVLREDAVPRA